MVYDLAVYDLADVLTDDAQSVSRVRMMGIIHEKRVSVHQA